jgi:hypothetical protein
MEDTTTSAPFYRIAIDPGFHTIKAATVFGEKLHTTTLQALVGVGETNIGLLQTGITRQRRNLPFTVVMEGQPYLVGPHVAKYARPIERLDFNRLTYSREMQALIYTAVQNLVSEITAELPPDQTIDLGLILALPVQVLQSADAREAIQSIETWLVGEHTFSLDNRPCRFRVHSIRAMAQPMGSLFEWGLNLEGQWARTPKDLKASIGVLDQGFNTIDLIHIQQGQIVKRFTSGDTLGQRRAARLMQELIEQHAGRKVTMHEADDYLRRYVIGQNPEMFVRGEEINLKEQAAQALDIAAGELRAFLSQVWEDGRQFDYILLTGGGSLALGNKLRFMFPNAIELIDPVTANARGLARYAQRRGVLEMTNQVAS